MSLACGFSVTLKTELRAKSFAFFNKTAYIIFPYSTLLEEHFIPIQIILNVSHGFSPALSHVESLMLQRDSHVCLLLTSYKISLLCCNRRISSD